MSMRLRWLEEPEKRSKPAKAAPAKRKKEKAAEEASRPADPMEHLQRAYGNAALGQMMQSLFAQEDVEIALSQLDPTYQELAMRLISEAAAKGEHERIRRFLALSAGQKLAALQVAASRAGAKRGAAPEHMADTGLEHWEFGIQAVSGVRLKKDEPQKEGDMADSGAKPQEPVPADVNGLLPPYKDIVLWLTYKANKQGKQDLMRRFFALSVPEKKLALKLMASKKKKALEFKALTEALTVPEQLKEWVDWDTVSGAMDKTQEMAAQLEEHQINELLEDKDAQMPDLEEDEKDGSGSLFAMLAGAALTGMDMLMGGEEEAPDRAKEQEMSVQGGDIPPEQAGWLLLGAKQSKPVPQVIEEFVKSRKDPKAVVDRFLQVPKAESDKALEKMRTMMLKRKGFSSVEQCYAHIMEIVANWIYEGGVVRQEPAYLRLLEELGLTKGKGQLPDLAEIIKKLTG